MGQAMKLGDRVRAAMAAGDFDAVRAMVRAASLGPGADGRVKVTQGPLPENWDRPVFVCGLHRSGTTIITRSIEDTLDVAEIDPHVGMWGEGQFLQDVYPMERPFGGPGMFAFFRDMQFDPLQGEPAREAARRLMRQWGAHFQGGAVPLEKSPPNLVRIAWLRSLFPKARFVIVTRDPRAVALATRKWSDSPLHELMMHWAAAHMVALRDMGADCLHVRYEDFCDDPDGNLDRIAAHCDLRPRAAPRPGITGGIRNSNDKYLAQWPGVPMQKLIVRAWEFFGYDFAPGHAGRPPE